MGDRDRYRINAPAVVSEIIDGEAVIMNLKSGNYYSTDAIGSRIWDWIEQGCARRQIEDALVAGYAADAAEIERAMTAFLDDLIAQGLVEPLAGGAPAATADAVPPPAIKKPFRPPTLSVYTDMKDLLLLDPIHDVDEAGWPTPKPQSL